MPTSAVTETVRRRVLANKWSRAGIVAAALSLGIAAATLELDAPSRTAADDAPARETHPQPEARAICARGRFEPKDGIVKVAGPSQTALFTNVISELRIKEGDRVEAGQIIALFDSYSSKQAAVQRLQAELAHAELEYRRFAKLFRDGVASAEERDDWRTRLEITKAQLQQAQADLDLARVRSPISGQVIKIHAYPGERVTTAGVAELGKTNEMYAVAEVYEDDIGRVHVGQRATVTSPALGDELQGTVESIGWKVAKMQVLDTDPAAKTDARVVKVKIRLDDSARVARLTNMQVDVRILP
jgi:HlyD family secretion protein